VSVAGETCVDFLRKVLRALKPDGIAVTVAFVPSHDRLTPMFRATFALAVLVLTTEGGACTFARLEELLQRAGSWQSTRRALEPSDQHAAISRK
jgi:hypothetical protein